MSSFPSRATSDAPAFGLTQSQSMPGGGSTVPLVSTATSNPSAYERMANLATRAGVEGSRFRIHTPLISLSKAEIVNLGTRLGVDYSLTWSCYDPGPDGAACGRCEACILRRKGFREAGMDDPARYGNNVKSER